MSRTFFAALHKITENPLVNIFVGLIFATTGVLEIIDGFQSEMKSNAIGVHHGAVLFGTVHILKSLPEFFEGAKYFEKSED